MDIWAWRLPAQRLRYISFFKHTFNKNKKKLFSRTLLFSLSFDTFEGTRQKPMFTCFSCFLSDDDMGDIHTQAHAWRERGVKKGEIMYGNANST